MTTASVPPAEPVQLGAATSELVDIVTRAYRRGFCRWRVATALRVSAHDLELIERIPGPPWP